MQLARTPLQRSCQCRVQELQEPAANSCQIISGIQCDRSEWSSELSCKKTGMCMNMGVGVGDICVLESVRAVVLVH